MRSKHTSNQKPSWAWIHSSRLHVVLYSLLLVATPFLLLRNFLQPTILILTRFGFEFAGREIPVVPLVALVLLMGSVFCFRRHLTRVHLLAGASVFLMIGLAQQLADYYFDHRIYDLQQNWHYLAYLMFSVMVHRDLAPRGVRTTRIMLVTFFLAVSFSTFDETVQLGMSGRSFEMTDIAKDAWGAVTGIVMLYIGSSKRDELRAQWGQIRQGTLLGYVENPASTVVLLTVLAFLFVCFSSLLGELEHWLAIVFLTAGTFVLFFVLFHLSQHKWIGRGLVTILLAGLLTQSYFYVKHRSDPNVYHEDGLTVYKGVLIPFLDVIIFPDGGFRPAPKKCFFSLRDRRFFLKQETDIILIGTGRRGEGGRGFPKEAVSQFMFNPFTKDGTQVIILPSPEACELFNRLKQEKKDVLFVLHSTT